MFEDLTIESFELRESISDEASLVTDSDSSANNTNSSESDIDGGFISSEKLIYNIRKNGINGLNIIWNCPLGLKRT